MPSIEVVVVSRVVDHGEALGELAGDELLPEILADGRESVQEATRSAVSILLIAKFARRDVLRPEVRVDVAQSVGDEEVLVVLDRPGHRERHASS